MPHYEWLLFALVVAGPLAGALLLDRAGAGRAMSMIGLMVLAAGGAGLLYHTARPAPGTASTIASPGAVSPARVTAAPPPRPAMPDLAPQLAEEKAAHERTRRDAAGLRLQLVSIEEQRGKTASDIAALRGELDAERAAHARAREALVEAKANSAPTAGAAAAAALEAERTAHARAQAELAAAREQVKALQASSAAAVDTAVASVLTVLDSERAAHDKTRIALAAVQDQVAGLEAARKQLAEDLEQARRGRDAASPTGGQKAAPTMDTSPQRAQEAAAPPVSGSAGPVSTAAAPIVAPSPFSGTRPAAVPTPSSPLRATLAAGLVTNAFTLTADPDEEIVQGRRGTYYRVVCRGQGGKKRIAFASGSYNPADGDAGVEACARSLREAVISKLPAAVDSGLYVLGYASDQRFIKPKPIPAADAHMKSVSYLPRASTGAQFGATAGKLTVTAFANKEVSTLRGAYIADVVGTATKGALAPVALEGTVKPASDEAATSFDLILFARW
ncbi:MAG: hypothetical protein SFW09_12045 [Hyphomicrobiaceae bacterium]|nr:hypothetical protein [Hyphomicrobiaceae bacterium]